MRMYRTKREFKPLVYLVTSFFVTSILITAPTFAEETPATFTFTGSGYGHGVGMSQIGARGQALEGKSAIEILNYYYPGTTVTSQIDTQTIRVNIGHLQSTTEFALLNEVGSFQLLSGDLPVGVPGVELGSYLRDIKVSFLVFGNSIIPQLTSPTAKFAAISGETSWTLRWSPAAVITSKIANQTFQLKYGQINLKLLQTSAGPKMEITNSLRLHDEYLWGIGEVPSSWPAAALEAQAIASRTYALNKINSVKKDCDCNVYATTADQNFVGYTKEIEAIYGTVWKAAVTRTNSDSNTSLIVSFNGKAAATYFFSSSAGTTQNVTEVWGGTIPYLTGVPDPWSKDAKINPRYFTWQRDISQQVMAAAFGLPDVISYQILGRTKTGSVRLISAISSAGKSSVISGEVFRSKTKLPSTWFALPTPAEIEALVDVCVFPDSKFPYQRNLC